MNVAMKLEFPSMIIASEFWLIQSSIYFIICSFCCTNASSTNVVVSSSWLLSMHIDPIDVNYVIDWMNSWLIPERDNQMFILTKLNYKFLSIHVRAINYEYD